MICICKCQNLPNIIDITVMEQKLTNSVKVLRNTYKIQTLKFIQCLLFTKKFCETPSMRNRPAETCPENMYRNKSVTVSAKRHGNT